MSPTDMHEIPEVGRMPYFDNEDKAEISNETKRFQRHLDHVHTPDIQGGDIDVPHPPQGQRRTLFHPLEAAQRSFGATSSEVVVCIFLGQGGYPSQLCLTLRGDNHCYGKCEIFIWNNNRVFEPAKLIADYHVSFTFYGFVKKLDLLEDLY